MAGAFIIAATRFDRSARRNGLRLRFTLFALAGFEGGVAVVHGRVGASKCGSRMAGPLWVAGKCPSRRGRSLSKDRSRPPALASSADRSFRSRIGLRHVLTGSGLARPRSSPRAPARHTDSRPSRTPIVKNTPENSSISRNSPTRCRLSSTISPLPPFLAPAILYFAGPRSTSPSH